MTGDEERTLLVDASAFITLAEVDAVALLTGLDGTVCVPQAVADEIESEPAASELEEALNDWLTSAAVTDRELRAAAADHLGRSSDPDDWGGDVPLLAAALSRENPVVVSDDRPLRETCKALSVPVSGSIGVLVHAVERGAIDADEAKGTLAAMDEVGARLSASLYRRAERLIDGASE